MKSNSLFVQSSTLLPISLQLPSVAILSSNTSVQKCQPVFLISDNKTDYCGGNQWKALLTNKDI